MSAQRSERLRYIHFVLLVFIYFVFCFFVTVHGLFSSCKQGLLFVAMCVGFSLRWLLLLQSSGSKARWLQ